MAEKFSLERLEQLVARRSYEDAALELVRMLDQLNVEHGALGGMRLDASEIARIAAAISALFADPGFRFSELGYRQLSSHHRWITAIFGASVFRTSDHILRSFNVAPQERPGDLEIAQSDLYKFCLLYSLDSRVPLQLDPLWGQDKSLATTLCFALLSARIVLSEAAHSKRELLLEWLPPRLADVQLEMVPHTYLHDVWMHCSYAATPRKHEIKRAINGMIRRWLAAAGLLANEPPRATAALPPSVERPTLVLVFDWYHPEHAVYRVFSKVLATLRSRFRLVAMGLHSDLNAAGLASDFDEVLDHSKPSGNVQDVIARIRQDVAAREPHMVFYVGVGMSRLGIFLANMRMAPVQIASHGHPSSTFSECIDYFLLEDSYAGLEQEFSERLLFVPEQSWPQQAPSVPALPARAPTTQLNIVVVLSVMKLNPVFLRACRAVLEGCGVPARLHIMLGAAHGVAATYIDGLIRDVVRDAVVYPQLGPDQYRQVIASCDMYLEPFSFGNSNSAVDCLMLGVPGVHMRGSQIFGRMGSVVLDRCGMDPRVVATSVEEYVAIGCEMARNAQWRTQLGSYLLDAMSAENIGQRPLFNGDPQPFADVVMQALRTDPGPGFEAGGVGRFLQHGPTIGR